MSLKLFYLPGACSLSLHILFNEAKIPNVEYIRYRFTREGPKLGDELINKFNPKGRVPALQLENGKILTECAVIIQYLTFLYPDAHFLPTQGDAKWEALTLLNYIATEFHQSFNPLRQPYASDEFKSAHKASQIDRHLRYINSLLQSKDYLLGDRFSAIDSYAYTISRWGLNVNLDYSPYANVIDWQKRIETRPSVQKSLQEERIPLLYPKEVGSGSSRL